MNGRKHRVLWKRTTAYLLTIALGFSLLTGTGFTSYASETEEERLELSEEQGTTSDPAGETQEQTKAAEDETGEEETGEAEAGTGEEESGEAQGESGGEEIEETEGAGESKRDDAGEEKTSAAVVEEQDLVGTENAYIGQVQDTSLDIDSEKMGDNFNEAGIKALLANYSEGQFTHINLNVSGTEKIIDCGIYNALLPYLDSTQSRFIYYRFTGDTYINWCFGEPKQIEDSLTEIDPCVTLSVSDGKATANMNADAASLAKCADFVEVGLGYPTETENAKALEELFGMEYRRLNVLSETGDRVSSVDVNWSPSEGVDFLYIQNVQNVKSHSFVIGDAPYKGDIWDDGTLSISEWEMGESFTAEGISSLLSTYYSDKKFSCIYFQQDIKEDNRISKDILNGVISYLIEDGSSVNFSFNGSEACVTWRIQSPKELKEDISANIIIDVDDSNTVSVTVPDTSCLPENISVDYWSGGYSTLKKKLTEALGTIGKPLSLFAPEEAQPHQNARAYWWNYDNGCSLTFYGVHNLQSGTPYVIKDSVYRGDVWSDENGSYIHISSRSLDKGKFADGELADIINWYAGQGITFDTVSIQEDYSSNNIIKKDYFNLARKILSTDEGSEKRLTFVFCRCEDREEEGVEPIAQNDLNWHFWNPGEATVNIDANVSLTCTEGYGVTLKLAAANTYHADNVEVSFYVEENDGVELADQLKAALGETSEEGSDVIALKGGTTLEDGVCAYYGRDNRENDNARIYLGMNNVQNWTAKTDYVVAPVKNIETVYGVGTEVELRQSEDFALSHTPSTTSSGNEIVPKVTWRSHATDAVVINSFKLSVLDQCDNAYVSASYTSTDNKKCLDVFRLQTEKRITQIRFDKSELTMKLERDEEGNYQECREYLNVKFYPSDMGCDIRNENEIAWISYDEDVVVIDRDEEDNPYIRAVGPGEAWVTAIYCKDYSENPEMSSIRAYCKVTVLDAITIADEDWPDYEGKLVAVTNFDTKLGDVHLPKGWKWVDESISLTPFKDMEGHNFAATYTATAGNGFERTETYSLWVRMVTITGVSIVALVPETEENNGEWVETELPKSIKNDEAITLSGQLDVKNGDMSDIPMEMLGWLESTWTSNPTGIGACENGLYTFAPGNTEAGKKAGKKTFTLTVTNKKIGKVFAKNSCSITVTQKPVLNFDEDVMWDVDHEAQKILFHIRSEKYDVLTGKKLTVKSEDTSILKLGALKEEETWTDEEEGAEYRTVSIPYTQKGNGLVYLTVTAMDEAKSSRSYALYDFIDTEPRVLTPVITMNRQKVDTATPVTISFEDGSLVVGEQGIKLTGTNSDQFSLACDWAEEYDEKSYGKLDRVWLSLDEGSELKGKNQVTIEIPVARLIYSPDGLSVENIETVDTYEVTVTVNITDSVPSVTFKQSRKVNTFYTDEEGDGVLTFTVKDGTAIEDLELTGCDYALAHTENEDQYFIVIHDNGGANKNGTLTYRLEGYRNTVSKSFKVAVESKKPAIVLAAKSDTLYPSVGYGTAVLFLTDKATGEAIDIGSARYVEDKKKGVLPEIPKAEDEFTEPLHRASKYNTYDMLHEGENGVITFSLAGDDIKAKTDKIALQVKEANWADYVDVSFSIKTDTTEKPKLKLGSNTITLNSNREVYQYQQVKTSLSLSGCSNLLNEETEVWFTGKDTKSNDVLKIKGSLVLQYWSDQGQVIVRLNDNFVTDGTYKYDVWVRNGDFTASTPLTIKVKNTKPDKCISVSVKGSIDVLDREGTSIAYTPKLSNVTGVVEHGWLSGQDADLFESYFEDGKLYVKAKEGASYSTKNTYKIKAAFWVQTEDYNGYEMESKELSVKVKQGKPKVSVSSFENTLYRSTGNCVEVNISALLGAKDVVIEEVTLLNYTGDLRLVGDFYNANPDEEDDPWFRAYNPDTKSVLLTTTGDAKSILKGGKTWPLKLAVHYRDQAGNEKDTQVTYKVCVK